MAHMQNHSANRFSDLNALSFYKAGMSSSSTEGFTTSSMYHAWAGLVDESCQAGAAEPLQSIVAGFAQPHYGGDGDNILVSFSGPAPSGWVLHLSSSHSAIQLPVAYSVPQGAYNVFVPFVSEAVKEPVEVGISANLCGQTLSTTLNVLPREK
jgi:hypothetical protein